MSTTVQSVLCLISTLLFAALLTLQVLEYLYYQSPPSIWPTP